MAVLTDMYVDIGGRNMHVVRSGGDGTAVILEAGSGCGSEIWRTVQELAGEFAAPYLLVGHSLGGHIARAFTARHLADVVGMALVDARHEDLYPVLPKSFLARLAELVPDGSERANRADAIVRELPALDDLPLTVITHGRNDCISVAFGLGQDDLDQAEAAWQQYQRKLAAKSARSKLLVAGASGHLIPVDQPELVAASHHGSDRVGPGSAPPPRETPAQRPHLSRAFRIYLRTQRVAAGELATLVTALFVTFFPLMAVPCSRSRTTVRYVYALGRDSTRKRRHIGRSVLVPAGVTQNRTAVNHIRN